MDKDGKFVVAGKRLNEQQLAERVRQEVADRGTDIEVTVASDKDARHESFVRLLDILREAEIYRFAIQTNLAEDEN